MRIPASPPDYRAIVVGNPGTLLAAIDAARALRGYPHWDKLRRLALPDRLTHEQWWAGVKVLRHYEGLPLLDARGDEFKYSMPAEVLQLVHSVSIATAGRMGAADRVLSDANRDRYLMSSLREEAISSSLLEGAATTRLVAKEMLRSARRPRTKGEQMIANNYAAMQWIRVRRDEPITPDRVLELHAILTDKTMEDPADVGRIQGPDEPRVGVYSNLGDELHRPPGAEALHDRLAELCRFASGESGADPWLHPLLRAIITHFMVGYDHYFVDGNGRTARALFYWVCLREGHWLMEYVSLSRVLYAAPVQYGRAYLYTETDEGDVTYFVLHQLGALERALDDLGAYLDRKQRELASAQLVTRSLDLNHRQRAAMTAVLEDPGLAITAKSHANSHGVTVQTARTDLAGMEAMGLLAAGRAGRAVAWRVKPDLPEALRQVGGEVQM